MTIAVGCTATVHTCLRLWIHGVKHHLAFRRTTGGPRLHLVCDIRGIHLKSSTQHSLSFPRNVDSHSIIRVQTGQIYIVSKSDIGHITIVDCRSHIDLSLRTQFSTFQTEAVRPHIIIVCLFIPFMLDIALGGWYHDEPHLLHILGNSHTHLTGLLCLSLAIHGVCIEILTRAVIHQCHIAQAETTIFIV